jgi:hypothetical protein
VFARYALPALRWMTTIRSMPRTCASCVVCGVAWLAAPVVRAGGGQLPVAWLFSSPETFCFRLRCVSLPSASHTHALVRCSDATYKATVELSASVAEIEKELLEVSVFSLAVACLCVPLPCSLSPSLSLTLPRPLSPSPSFSCLLRCPVNMLCCGVASLCASRVDPSQVRDRDLSEEGDRAKFVALLRKLREMEDAVHQKRYVSVLSVCMLCRHCPAICCVRCWRWLRNLICTAP